MGLTTRSKPFQKKTLSMKSNFHPHHALRFALPGLCLTSITLAITSLALPALAQEAAADTQTIEVKGVRLREKAGQQSLSREELLRMPGSSGDPMKAVQALPGIAVVDDASSEPAVRGSRPSDNAYVVDFLPVGYLFHVGGFASVFNPDLIRRFDVYSAAWSPEYPNVVGAVFDLSLRSPRSDRIGGKVDISLLGANALVEGPIGDDKSFFFAARRSYFDLATKTVEDKEEGVTVTIPVYSDAQGRFIYNINSKNRLRLDFSAATDRISFTTKADSKIVQREPVLIGNSTDKQQYTSLAAVYDVDLGAKSSFTAAIGNMNTRQFTRLGLAGTVDAKVNTAYVKSEWALNTFTDHSLVLGGQVQQRKIDLNLDFLLARCTEFDPNCDLTSAPRFVTSQKSTQNLGEISLSDRWQFLPGWVLAPGLRASYDGLLKQTISEPRLGLEWGASAETVLSAGIGQHNQLPAIDQALQRIGNPKLKHLQSTHSVLGVQLKFGTQWSVRAEVYHKDFKNYAVSDPVLNYRNGASGKANGLEFLIKRDSLKANEERTGFLDRFSGFASISLSKSYRTIDGSGASFPFDFDQPVIANFVGSYKLNDRWSFGAKWSYHTGQPYTPVVGTGTFPDGRAKPIYGEINSQRVPAYHKLDLRADAKWTPNFTSYFELINAYNRKNVAGYTYSADYTKRDPVYQLPLLPSFGVQYSF
jgi:TonB dependent receptor/TonB-dependent Receptor Plug Domain